MLLTELATLGELERLLAPADEHARELLVLLSVDPKLVLAEP